MDSEIKLELFRKIDSLQGERLERLYGIFLNFLNEESTKYDDELTEEAINSIEVGLSQLEKGERKAHSDVINEFRKKYSKGN